MRSNCCMVGARGVVAAQWQIQGQKQLPAPVARLPLTLHLHRPGMQACRGESTGAGGTSWMQMASGGVLWLIT
jgi:hypothetical protein